MKISACIITKNEENNIDKCIDSLKNIADEVIVVDTGSSDATISLAKKNGANVYNIDWNNDFSNARNFAKDKASGDWILFLDADEYVSKDFEIKNIKANKNVDAYLVKIINIDNDNNGKVIDEFYAIRFFKNSSKIKYVGKIHEQLINVDKKELIINSSPLNMKIYHTGYSEKNMPLKAKRNLEMLLDELKNSENKERLYSYLAETYNYLGDYYNAEKYAQMDIDRGRRNVSYASRSYRILIEIYKNNVYRIDKLKNVIEKAIIDFPKIPEFKAELALYYAEKFDYDNAIKNMNEAIKLSKKYDDIEPSLFNDDKIILAQQMIDEWINIREKKNKIKISACVIVKNEEKNIEKWLKNSLIYADEQIVIDTGSSDRTNEIVKKSSAKLYHYEWKDDFSKAKNFAISKAEGDWIVFLDADEYFSKETVKNVREIIAKEDANIETVDAILCTIINIDEDQNNKELHRFINLRIFRNTDYLRFYGNIHEGVKNSKGQLKILIEKEKLQVIHTGYSKNIIDSKIKRNLELLLDDIEKNGEGIQHYRYLLDCYHALGEHDKAIKYGKLHINSEATSIGCESDVYRNLINSMIILKKDPEEIEMYLKDAITKFPNLPDFYSYYAANLFRAEKYSEAKFYLEKAIEIYDYKKFDNMSTEATVFNNILSETYSYLAEVFIKENNIELAKKNIYKALNDNKYNQMAFNQLIKIYRNKEIALIIKELSIFYKDKNEKDFVLVMLYEGLTDEIFKKIFLEYKKLFEREYKYINNKLSIAGEILNSNMDDAKGLLANAILEDVKKFAIVVFIKNDEKFAIDNIGYFPDALNKVVKRYFNKTGFLENNDYDSFVFLLLEVMKSENDILIEKFFKIVDDFDILLQFNIALLFCENELWIYANKLIENILINTRDQSDEMIYWCAISNYYLGNIDKAKNYFEQIRKFKSRENEIEAYLTWIAKENKNA